MKLSLFINSVSFSQETSSAFLLQEPIKFHKIAELKPTHRKNNGHFNKITPDRKWKQKNLKYPEIKLINDG